MDIQLVNKLEEGVDLDDLFSEIVKTYHSNALALYRTVLSILEAKTEEPVPLYENRDLPGHNGEITRLLVEHAQKPAVVYSKNRTKEGGVIMVSGRAPRKTVAKIDLVPLFKKYGGGGHRRACGLRLASEQKEEFLQDVKAIGFFTQ